MKGNQLGRTLGFPTANIQVNSELKLIPSSGSYAVLIEIGTQGYKGMLNIGMRPTVNQEDPKQTIEVHIFNFEGNIYGKEITIKFIKLIRKEEKFESLEALKAQLAQDEQSALHILSASDLNIV